MKQLIIVRHGKSSWDYEVNDKDRPLKERGINDAHSVSRHFSQSMPEVDAVFSSPANRALHTCMIFMRELGLPLENVRITDRLYDFSGDSVLKFVKDLDDQHKTVMIFGHNFAFTNVANTLGDQYIDNVPTSGLVHLKLETSHWKSAGKSKTAQVIFPKLIRSL